VEVDPEWIDAAVPPEQKFSATRTSRLFLSIMAASIIGGLPLGLYQLGVNEWQRRQAEAEQQGKMRKEWENLGEAARTGKTGPAFQRLLGVEPTNKKDN
jgi:hypothetical protein